MLKWNYLLVVPFFIPIFAPRFENVMILSMKRTCLLTLFLASLGAFGQSNGKLPSNVDKTQHWTLNSTYYHAVKKQCNDQPLITANGTKVIPSKVKSGEQKIVAFSRDLFRLGFKMGEKVWIDELGAYYEIADTMNKRYIRSIDVLVHSSQTMPHQTLTIRKVLKNS